MNSNEKSVIIGIFYLRGNKPGDLVYTYALHEGKISFYDAHGNYDTELRSVVENTWIQKPKVVDFPGSDNPRLPDAYELLWGIKRLNDVRSLQGKKLAGALTKLKNDYPSLDWANAIPWKALKAKISLDNDIAGGMAEQNKKI